MIMWIHPMTQWIDLPKDYFVYMISLNTICCQIAWVDASNSIEIIFCICSHRAITDGIRNTQQCKTSSNLVIIKEALIALIDWTRRHLRGTGWAGTCTTWIRHINSILLRSIKNILIIRAIDYCFNSITKDRHLEISHLNNCNGIIVLAVPA